jgi:energy-coupling factor transport system permease protein
MFRAPHRRPPDRSDRVAGTGALAGGGNIGAGRVPRGLHPAAWWLWALGLATAASRTTNPLLLALILAVAWFVVVARRGDAPWALGFRLYLWLGALIVGFRVLFRIAFGGGQGDRVLVTLPQIPLPEFTSGVRLFGPVAAEELLAGFTDGLRLATMLICLGAANALANPKRLLRSLPGALYEVGTAVVVALSVAPQLVESVLRVRRARRLRGAGARGARAVRGIAMPVLQDALERSLALAAAMDSRGYGRRGTASRRSRTVTGSLVLAGLVGICVGVYGLLDGTAPGPLGPPLLAAGLVLAGAGFLLGGRLVHRSVYRPDRWRLPELAVAACGVVAAAGMLLAAPEHAHPPLMPLAWPQLGPAPAAGVLVAALPAWLAPPPPRGDQP